MAPTELSVDGTSGPLGIDDARPHLSWRLTGTGRDRRQTAYRVLVAREGDPLDQGARIVWDSGAVSSAETTGVGYGGEPLQSRTRYIWRMRATDEHGRVSEWSGPAWFETGLLDEADWTAQWISAPWSPESERWPSLENVPRIWLAERDGELPERACFRAPFAVPSGCGRLSARLILAVPGEAAVYVNGFPVPVNVNGDAVRADVSDLVSSGENVLAVEASSERPEPPSLVTRLEVLPEGRLPRAHVEPTCSDVPVLVVTNARWRATQQPTDGWQLPGCDDGGWPRAEEVGRYEDPPWGRAAVSERPSPYFRTGFTVTGGVRRARLYATALGLYELYLNGRRVGDERLAPGWTDFNKRLAYQSYDVTDLIAEGGNALGAVLADGWYAGHICWFGPFHYGRRLQLRAQLEIVHDDGRLTRVGTDESWRVGQGTLRYADLQMGEWQDARYEAEGWACAGYDDPGWQSAVVGDGPRGRLVAQLAPPIRVHHELTPEGIREVRPGRWIVDFGQNLVGWVRLRVQGEAGQRVTLRHAEVLEPDGTLHTANLRSARQTDDYVLRGGGDEVFEPRFTVHGFRYVEVNGWPATLDRSAVTACVAYADMAATGHFSCSDPCLTRLQQNIVWGQRGNFLAVPTDCPSRDERLGWTGDAQVFAATAAFNMDVRAFFRKWLQDVADAQYPDGAVTNVAPDVVSGRGLGRVAGHAGWGDAVVIVPWALYHSYGDAWLVEEVYRPMREWVEYLQRNSEECVRPDDGFGDWLNVGAETPKDLIGTAYFAHAAQLLAQLAAALERDDDARCYAELYARVRRAFRDRFVEGGGRVVGGTQTAYALALGFGLLEEDEVPRAARRLVHDIEGRNWHLSTGFLGTPHLLDVLTSTGYLDVAYRLLTQRTYPSWLYPIIDGDATTMWERWDSWSHHRGLQDPTMNSFNHYAYGAVGDWIYRTIAGIDAGSPGYRHIVVRPRPGGGLTWAEGVLESVQGRIAVRWERDERAEEFQLDVDIPVNATAEVWVPSPDAGAVTESGVPATEAEGVTFEASRDGCAVFHIGSGSYRFNCQARRWSSPSPRVT